MCDKSSFRFRGFNYCPVRYKKIPLEGALEIWNKMIVSSIHENLSERMIEKPGLFADAFCNARYSKSTGTSEDIANEASIIYT